MIPPLLNTLENTINHLLRSDLEHQDKLIPLINFSAEIQCDFDSENPTFRFLILFDPTGVQLSVPSSEDEPNTYLKAPPLTLLNLALSQNTTLLQHPTVTLQGDVHRLQLATRLFQSLDIPWEEKLTPYLGKRFSHYGVKAGHKFQQFKQHMIAGVMENLQDYLQEEACLLPTQQQIEPTFNDIDALNLAVDRLSARIDALTEPKEPNS